MSEVISIVDYGAGNIRSVQNSLSALGVNSKIVATPEEVLRSGRLILPGVGSAQAAMKKLESLGIDQALTEAVRNKGRPMLGICLGMHLIADILNEHGKRQGFGWIDGSVIPLVDIGVTGSVPHMGWNSVQVEEIAEHLFKSIPVAKRKFYFSHSYTLSLLDDTSIASKTYYDVNLVSAVINHTVFGVQFHPEKSQLSGQTLIKNFLNWNP
jgi:glutamine amidotransferase